MDTMSVGTSSCLSQWAKAMENTSFMGTKYHTDVTFVAGLMPPGMQGVNHDIAVDGLTAVLTVKIQSDGAWFWAKHQKNTEALPVEVPVAGGMVAAEEPEENKVRRKRFSLARIVRPSGEHHRAEATAAKQGHVWTRSSRSPRRTRRRRPSSRVTMQRCTARSIPDQRLPMWLSWASAPTRPKTFPCQAEFLLLLLPSPPELHR